VDAIKPATGSVDAVGGGQVEILPLPSKRPEPGKFGGDE